VSRLDELKKEIMELEAKAKAQENHHAPQSIVDLDDPAWSAIPDNDPELAPFLEASAPAQDLDVIGKLIRKLCPGADRQRTLQEAKKIVASRRKHRAIYATIVDDMKPEAERLAAIQTVLEKLLEPGPHFLRQFSLEQLLQRVCPADTIRPFSDCKEQVRRPGDGPAALQITGPSADDGKLLRYSGGSRGYA
jgi:hypothetical protein